MSERLTLDRLAELRQIAEMATPGPWEVVGLSGYGGPYALRMPHRSGRTWYGVEAIKRREDAEYFAACDPDTIRALLAERDALAAKVERLEKMLRGTGVRVQEAGAEDMTITDVIEMARKAGGYDGFTSPPTDWDEGDFVISPEGLLKFATLVRNATIEEAAEEADRWQTALHDPRYECDCATAIRAMKENSNET